MSTVTIALVVSAALLALGCGAKTGLDVPDARVDASPPVDATVRDATVVDAPFCPDVPVELVRTDVETVFLMDGSGSMTFTWDGMPGGVGLPSRWRIVRDTLAAVLPPIDRRLAIGAKVFPNGVECDTRPGLDLAPRIGAVSDLLALFDRWHPEGGTPTARALRHVLDVPSTGPRVIVATLDGGPNCNPDPDPPPPMCVCTGPAWQCLAPPPDGAESCLDYRATLDAVRDSHEVHGTPVIVVGIDDPTRPDLSDFLDEMAIVGGWPRPAGSERRFFNASEPTDLRDAFGEVADLVSRCVFSVPSPPPEGASVVVRLGGELVPRDEAHVEGWDWTDRSRGAIAFFGAACDTLRTTDLVPTAEVLCAP